ncbi:MAG: c-type cytochrome biogenesis protein CcsB [Desulfobaccales bacterium]
MSQLLGVAMLIYLGVAIILIIAELWSSPLMQRAGRGLLWVGLALQSGALIGRWYVSYQMAARGTPPPFFLDKLRLIIFQAPLSNYYDSLVFFSWCLPAMGLLAFRRYLRGWLGAIVAMLACLLLAKASFGGVNANIQPLMPALKSNWLLIHVVICFFGYAALTVAFGAALLYLIQDYSPKGPLRALPALPLLDRLIYRAAILGFFLLTFGILTGAVWAETAWGKYWSWDPKEVASLVTWLIYAALLHARLLKGWQGRRIAWLAVLGFLAIIFTYFGVNYLQSMHAYMT